MYGIMSTKVFDNKNEPVLYQPEKNQQLINNDINH